jgi:hypothetical protein
MAAPAGFTPGGYYNQLVSANPPGRFDALKRWPDYYKELYAYYYLAGNFDAARQVVQLGADAGWQYNSAGLLYPNQTWFGQLTKAQQDEIVKYLNDPTSLAQAIQAASAAGNTQEYMRLAGLMSDIQQMRSHADAYMHGTSDPAALALGNAPQQYGGAPAQATQFPTTDPNQPPGGGNDTQPVGVDQGKYSQAIDETARGDPKSFVSWVLGQQGMDPYGNNPLSASALRKATLTPYMRELQAGGYQNAPLYTYADWLENWTKNNNAPGVAGGGNGTAFSFQQGKDAMKGLLSRAADPNSLEAANFYGSNMNPQDQLNTAQTYSAAAFADSLDPTYQRALQSYLDRQYQGWYSSMYGQGNSGSFVDWLNQNGFNFG